jgi:hypothetical protein
MTERTAMSMSATPEPASVGELVSGVSEQTTRLLRDEIRLAQFEITEKGKEAGLGAVCSVELACSRVSALPA